MTIINFSNEDSEEKWYSCLVPKCNFELPKWIEKSKDADFETLFYYLRFHNRRITKGMIAVLMVKIVMFLASDVAFPGYDVYTDCEAASEHYK